MTLKSRNRFLLAFIIAASMLFIFSAVRLGLSIYKNTIYIPESLARPFSFSMPQTILFSRNFYATSAGILFFLLYSIVVTIFLLVHFEKTQSIEVIYFMAFVTGCLFEGTRIFVPIESFWNKTSIVLALIGRIVITGRIAVSLGLLFSVIFNETEQRQYVERNFIILFIIAITIGQIYPISTVEILSTFMVQIGKEMLFSIFQYTLMCATLIIILHEGIINHVEKLSKEVIGFIMIIIGHNILCKSDCYMLLALGSAVLSIGSVIYLKYLHAQYLWK
ncbi:MAG: hypothetical protein K6G00_01730 [Treponema sp.]|nr:hypothetical protein [Treponema sp.]